MKTLIIPKQSDGYSVEADGDTITLIGAKGKNSLHCTYFKSFPELSEGIRSRILAMKMDTSGLWSEMGGVARIRDIGDAVAKVIAIQAEYRFAEENRKAEKEAEKKAAEMASEAKRAELQAACKPGYMVGKFVRYEEIPGSDGYGWCWYQLVDGTLVRLDNDVVAEPASEEMQGWYHRWMAIQDPRAAAERQTQAAKEEVEATAKKEAAAAAKREADHASLMAVVVPAEAVAAYRACGGDPDKLRDDIDHPAYWTVRQYAAAIEAQGLAQRETLKKWSSQIRSDQNTEG